MRRVMMAAVVGAATTWLILRGPTWFHESFAQGGEKPGFTAAGPVASQNGIVALTGQITNNVSGLWIVHTNAGVEQDGTPCVKVLLYLPAGVQGGIKLAGARNISYDIHARFSSYEDYTAKPLEFRKMREYIQQINRSDTAEGSQKRGP